jgi:hypothetical protein
MNILQQNRSSKLVSPFMNFHGSNRKYIREGGGKIEKEYKNFNSVQMFGGVKPYLLETFQ